jgi:hypothetical protein
MSGEFKESVQVTCPVCDGSGDDPDFDGDPTEHGGACLECNGEGTVAQNVPVSWDTIKDIYKAAVDLLAKAAPAAPVQPNPLSGALKHAREALRFYAGKGHFHMHQPDEWDTVSGEPQNFYEDSNNTATVEDGSIAKRALEDIFGAERYASLAAPVQAEQAQAEPSDDDKYAVIVDRHDLFDYLRAAWREGSSVGWTDTAESWHKATDYAEGAIKGWGTMRALPAQAEQVEAVRAALKPFADLAELFDDGKRASNMPNAGTICAWARRDQEYELTVEHLRAARDALATKEAAAVEAPSDTERDAARYRWLRDPDTDVALVLDKRTGFVPPVEGMAGIGGYHTYEYRAGEELDAAIDAAMSAQQIALGDTGGAK